MEETTLIITDSIHDINLQGTKRYLNKMRDGRWYVEGEINLDWGHIAMIFEKQKEKHYC